MSDFSPILELAFFNKEKFKFFTNSDYIFVVKNWSNGPPTLSLSLDRKNTSYNEDVDWFIYDEKKINWRTYYHRFGAPPYYHHRILSLCLLMLGLFVEKTEDIIMVAEGFSKSIIHKKSFFDPYKELNTQQLDYLLKMARNRLSRKYFVLSYCQQGIDIIQDIQQETAGMCLVQFRYDENLHDILNRQ